MSRTKKKRVTTVRHSSFVMQRGALTLIEMLIAMAITLLMMAAVVTLFANIGSGVRIRQATIEMSAELRDVRTMLYNDLTHATCRATTWQRPDEDPGYIEIVEGRFSDSNPTGLVLNTSLSQIPGSQNTPAGQTTDGTGLGDYDDIIALTVRREGAPFRGRTLDPNNRVASVESSVAEVIWFALENDGSDPTEEAGMRTVYRRQLIVAPWVDLTIFNNTSPPVATNSIALADSFLAFYQLSDVSVRIEPNSASSTGFVWVPNTLGDLTKRENRFAHYYFPGTNIANGFPHRFPYFTFDPSQSRRVRESDDPNSSLRPFAGDRAGEDFVIDNVLAFDVLVFDPGAPLFEYRGAVIEPTSSAIFTTSEAINLNGLVGFGAYVDLGWDDSYDYVPANFVGTGTNRIGPLPDFQEEREIGWHPFLGASGNITAVRGTPSVYDTWSLHYEYDGLNQDLDLLEDGTTPRIDEGTNGLDDDGINGVDDVGRIVFDDSGNPVYFPGERETSPPYDAPLRAVKVKLRIYESDTRQTREVSVTASFVPQ